MGKQCEREQLSVVKAQTNEQGLWSNRRESRRSALRRERRGEERSLAKVGRGAQTGLFQKCMRKGDNSMLFGQVIFVWPRLLPTDGAPQRCSTLVVEDSISRERGGAETGHLPLVPHTRRVSSRVFRP